MGSRLEAIRQIVAQRPDDPFPRYGLAMELKNSGDREAAASEYAAMAERFPDYVPRYLMHANLLVELGRKDEAIAVLRAGIPVAEAQRNSHAAGELAGALDALE